MEKQDKPCLYLHIGHPKAGSTTIQTFLFKNWHALRQLGYQIPSPSFAVSSSTVLPGNVLWQLEAMREKKNISPLFHWVETSLGQNPNAKLILSSENLAHPDWPGLFQKLAKLVDIKLIYYLRRQDELFVAAWRQWGLKQGKTLSKLVANRIKNNRPNYQETIDLWRKAGILSACHIRFINKAFLVNGDLQDDIASAIGFDSSLCEKVSNQNTAVDARLLSFLSEHSDLFTSEHEDTIIQLLWAPPEYSMQLDPDQFNAVQQTFEAGNQTLLRHYHPALAGTPVIDHQSTKNFLHEHMISEKEKREYVIQRLKAAENIAHPLLLKLKKILTQAAP
ncbi:hypothetical protein [Kordiimonas pumila]|uniref:Sulfotransferase family protein n=1 Tax=Kordiimonas pumila TaxID=2161677 RepID=A0ABV7D7A5_9PROT|nr:hypothetical protein [Kordiimonas pumila]